MDRLKIERPNLQIVQIGLKSAQPLTSVVDLRGLTTFREAALVLPEAALFVGAEGGMMHAANAVSALLSAGSLSVGRKRCRGR